MNNSESVCAVLGRFPYKGLSIQAGTSYGSEIFLISSGADEVHHRDHLDNRRYLNLNPEQWLYVNITKYALERNSTKIATLSTWSSRNVHEKGQEIPAQLASKLQFGQNDTRQLDLSISIDMKRMSFSNNQMQVVVGEGRELISTQETDLYWAMWGFSHYALFEATIDDTPEELISRFSKLMGSTQI